MPAPVQDIIVTPTVAPIQVSLEPAYNAIHSLLLLAKDERISGLADWITKTRSSMSTAEQQRHQLVMIGFFFAVVPEQSWPSFTAYLNHLASMRPMDLRDKLLDAYINLPCLDKEIDPTAVNKGAVLASPDSFLDFLGRRFSPEHIDRDVESRAYEYILDPPAMQSLIVSHLQHMWDAYLVGEWERVRPMLQDAVTAFEQVDFGLMNKHEAAEFITGQSLADDRWEMKLERAERLIFVPSAHVGPYLGHFKAGKTLSILFGARLPEGIQFHAPDLSRAEILVRLSALADDNRLRILKLIAEEGEMRSQDIMLQLDLSQSAASRHLKQLSATGYLFERRCEGAKCYKLNVERIEDTLHAISAFLIV